MVFGADGADLYLLARIVFDHDRLMGLNYPFQEAADIVRKLLNRQMCSLLSQWCSLLLSAIFTCIV